MKGTWSSQSITIMMLSICDYCAQPLKQYGACSNTIVLVYQLQQHQASCSQEEEAEGRLLNRVGWSIERHTRADNPGLADSATDG